MLPLKYYYQQVLVNGNFLSRSCYNDRGTYVENIIAVNILFLFLFLTNI